MKIKSILTGCLTVAAMAACLIPLLAQEPVPKDRIRDDVRFYEADGTAQRERADLFTAAQSARAPQTQGYAVASPNSDFGIAQRSQLNNQNLRHPAPNVLATTGTLFGRSAFDPDLAKAINESNAEVGKLIKQLKETEELPEKDSIKDKIKTELDLQYDAYLDHHEKPLKQLEERLAKLRKEFDARKQAKDDLVKLRLETIWYDSLGLGWPSNRTTTIYGSGPGLGQNPLTPFGTFEGPRYPNNPAVCDLASPIPNPPTPPTPPVVPTRIPGSGR